jgi:hypothetical protein
VSPIELTEGKPGGMAITNGNSVPSMGRQTDAEILLTLAKNIF